MTELELKYFKSKVALRLDFTIEWLKVKANTETETKGVNKENTPLWVKNGFGYDLLCSAGIQVCTAQEKKEAWAKANASDTNFPEADAKDELFFSYLRQPQNGFTQIAELLEEKKAEIVANELARIDKKTKTPEKKELIADLVAYLDCDLPKEGIGFEAEKRLIAALGTVGIKLSKQGAENAMAAAKNDENEYTRLVSAKLWTAATAEKRKEAAANMVAGKV
jgi:ribosomal protein L15